MDLNKEILEKCVHVWEIPDNGNAGVIIGRGKRVGYVVVADLDMGVFHTVSLSELTKKIRDTEETDLDYSWFCEYVNRDISEEVSDAEYRRKYPPVQPGEEE